ncbi:DUF309 domain-containing protein [Streptomyces racemochromogenes]|uniref:DUF309 domain-containing protein n=1 Tax=Streptomyces racemochromogenes TaxID=67353 RepID=A0ABW7PHH4_9ACTN
MRSPGETVAEAQRLLDAGMPFHAHEVFEDAWKSGPEEDAALWRGLAQLAVGLTHAARGNAVGGARLLRRGAASLGGVERAYGMDLPGLLRWADELAHRVGAGAAVDPVREAPRLGGGGL